MLKRGEKEIDLSVFGTIFQSAMSRIHAQVYVAYAVERHL